MLPAGDAATGRRDMSLRARAGVGAVVFALICLGFLVIALGALVIIFKTAKGSYEFFRWLHISRDATLKEDLPGDGSRALRPFRILAERGGRPEVHAADVVIDASGTWGQMRPLGDGGMRYGEKSCPRQQGCECYRSHDFNPPNRAVAVGIDGSGHLRVTLRQ